MGGSAVTLAEVVSSSFLLVGGSEVDTDGARTGAVSTTGLSTGGGAGTLVSVAEDVLPLPIPDRKDSVLPGGGFGLSSKGVGAFVGIANVTQHIIPRQNFLSIHIKRLDKLGIGLSITGEGC